MFLRIYFPLLFLILPLLTHGQKNDSLGNFGHASYYHDMFDGRETSNGEIYDNDDFTAAHRTYPFNTILLVTNKKNNKSVVVRVNDRGPFKKSRVIDLSRSAAKKIGMVPLGVVSVKIKVLNFLNPDIMSDEFLKEGEIWDCYGKKQSINDTAVFIWKTQNWKHAFYMASCLTLEYHLNSLFVKINGPSEKRNYDLLVANFENGQDKKVLVNKLISDGFFQSKIIYPPYKK